MAEKLIIIDMQEIFRAADSEWFIPEYADTEKNVLQLARSYGQEVVWTRFVRDPLEHGSWQGYYQRWQGCREPGDSTRWDITLEQGPGANLVSLPTFSKWGPDLARLTQDSDTLVVCGVATDCCVLSTVLGAVDAGKYVKVVVDACAGITAKAHEQALSVMDLLSPMVVLVNTKELVSGRS